MTVFAGSRRPAARLLGAAAAASLAIAPILSAHAQVIGVNAAVRNSVQIRGAGSQQLRPAVLRQRVGLNDEVRTGSQSQLQILLLDRSVFTVGSNARLTVDRFVYDPARSVRSVGATVTRGAFRFMSGRSLGPSRSGSSAIRTPVATIGIRGTIVEGVVGPDAIAIAAGETAVGAAVGGDEDRASLIVLRGPGAQTQGDLRPGVIDVESGSRTMTLDRPSLAVYIPRLGAAPIGPFLISRVGLIRIRQLLAPPLSLVPVLAAGPDAAGAAPPAEPGDGAGDIVTGAEGQPPGQAPAAAPGVADQPRSGRGPLLLAGLAVLIVVLVLTLGDGDGSPRSP